MSMRCLVSVYLVSSNYQLDLLLCVVWHIRALCLCISASVPSPSYNALLLAFAILSICCARRAAGCEYCTSVATCSAPVGCRRSPPLPFSFSFKLCRFRFTDSNIIIFKVFLYTSRKLKPQKPEFMLLKLFTVYNNNKHCWLVRQTLLRTFNKTFMQVNVNWNDWN